MADGDRPLSPHLQVYRWQITMVLSIAHRGSGLLLALASLLLVGWLLAAASGPDAHAAMLAFLQSWPVRIALAFVSLAFFYHLCNGIRHLCWDAGWGFEIAQLQRSGWAAVVATAVLTAAFWLLLAGGRG